MFFVIKETKYQTKVKVSKRDEDFFYNFFKRCKTKELHNDPPTLCILALVCPWSAFHLEVATSYSLILKESRIAFKYF